MPRRRWLAAWTGRRASGSPLGEGAWRRAHDRFHRAVDRVHQVADGVPAGPTREGLAAVAARLADLTGDVHAVCVHAQAVAPSTGHEVPAGHGGRLLDLHRALSRAGTMAAQAAEAATMARVAEHAGEDAAARHVTAAHRAAEATSGLVVAAAGIAATLAPEAGTAPPP